MNELLLDTHTWIWLNTGAPLRNQTAVASAAAAGVLALSPISCCELGMLVSRGRIVLGRAPRQWVSDALQGLTLAELTPEIALDASFLPGVVHGDPADRLLIATARARNATLATRDRKLLDYAEQGHLRALEV